MEKKKEEKPIIKDSSLSENDNEDKDFKIYELMNSVFKDKSKHKEIIEKLRPFFTLKVIPQSEIEKVYVVEKIPPEKIDLIQEFKYEEEKYSSQNLFETKSKSVGLSDNDLNLSISIFGHKQSVEYDGKKENVDSNSLIKKKIHCIHSIVVSLFKIVIDLKEIKFVKEVNDELIEIQNANVTEKKLLLEKLADRFGLYVPKELLVGGRINIYFDANNKEEINQIHKVLQNDIKAKFEGRIKFVSGGLDFSHESKNTKNDFSHSLNNIENLSIKMNGGNYTYKEDYKKWIQSFNLDNLQIIGYKTLIPIYYFIQGLETKLTKLCLQKYEDIVLQEINNLIEKDFIQKEQEIFQGSSETINSWKIGITKEIYKSFIIYKKKIQKKLKITKNEKNNNSINEKKRINNDVICGEIPDGFIICGWLIKTNSNSKPYDVICNWERKKELQIIGNDCFKFKVNVIDDNNIDEDIEIRWTVEIFCIHSDFLVPQKSSNINNSNMNIEHYFINCDCCNQSNCYYNGFYTKENWRKVDIENFNKITKPPINNKPPLFQQNQNINRQQSYGNLFG